MSTANRPSGLRLRPLPVSIITPPKVLVVAIGNVYAEKELNVPSSDIDRLSPIFIKPNVDVVAVLREIILDSKLILFPIITPPSVLVVAAGNV